jgi:hypothetical protein
MAEKVRLMARKGDSSEVLVVSAETAAREARRLRDLGWRVRLLRKPDDGERGLGEPIRDEVPDRSL